MVESEQVSDKTVQVLAIVLCKSKGSYNNFIDRLFSCCVLGVLAVLCFVVISAQLATGLTLVMCIVDPSFWSLALHLQNTHLSVVTAQIFLAQFSLKNFKFSFDKFIYLFIYKY